MESKMDYKRISGLGLLFAALLFGFLISTAYYSTRDVEQAPTWWRGLRMTGTVTDVTPDSIKIKLEDGKEMSFKIDKLTKISLTGRIELKKDAWVTVIYKKFNNPDEIPIAKWIREIEKAGADTGAASSVTPAAPSAQPTGATVNTETPVAVPTLPEATTNKSPVPEKSLPGAIMTEAPGTVSSSPGMEPTTPPGATETNKPSGI